MNLIKPYTKEILRRSSSTLAACPQVLHVPSSPPFSNTSGSTRQPFYMNKTLDNYISQSPTSLTLRQLIFYERHINTERLLKSANYVRTELPIRIAHRIREFQKLPYILGTNPHIEGVYELYWQAFERIRKIPPIETRQENEVFCEILQESLDAHLVVIPQLAKGIIECEQQQQHIMSMDKLDQFMNATLRSRISRRVLTEHHLVLSNKRKSIFNVCSSHNVLTKCIHLVNASSHEGISPKITLNGSDTEFQYVSDHVEYIVYQLLSNAFRHSISTTGEQREIKVTTCSNETDVLFRISDQGGGMCKKEFNNIWSYGNFKRFGNMEKVQQLEAKLNEHELLRIRLGIGLPMSKVYAGYFGGSLELFTMEGYGTDAYVRIPRLGTTNENLDN